MFRLKQNGCQTIIYNTNIELVRMNELLKYPAGNNELICNDKNNHIFKNEKKITR